MKITKRWVDQVSASAKDAFFWDDTLKGFGLKVTRGGKKNFVLQTRLKGELRRFTIGQYGQPWSVDQARQKALEILADITRDIDLLAEKRAARQQISLAELAERYQATGMNHKRQSTRDVEAGLIKRHILPLLGRRRVAELTKADIQMFVHDIAAGKTATDVKTKSRGRAIVKGGQGTANRTLDLLASMLTFAVDIGARSDNPAKGMKKFNLKKHDRYLTAEELSRLGKALNEASDVGASQFALSAIKFLLLTGCRRGEALTLRWSWVDLDRQIAKLPVSKTGQKVVVLGDGAVELLKGLPRVEGSELVFPSSAGGNVPISLQKAWAKVRDRAGLSDLRLHDLRHNFASTAVSSGHSLYLVGKLLGHTQPQATQRYAHLADDPVREAANIVSISVVEGLKL